MTFDEWLKSSHIADEARNYNLGVRELMERAWEAALRHAPRELPTSPDGQPGRPSPSESGAALVGTGEPKTWRTVGRGACVRCKNPDTHVYRRDGESNDYCRPCLFRLGEPAPKEKP